MDGDSMAVPVAAFGAGCSCAEVAEFAGVFGGRSVRGRRLRCACACHGVCALYVFEKRRRVPEELRSHNLKTRSFQSST